MIEILFTYLHFLGIFGLFATLTVEHLLLDTSIPYKTVRRLSRVDRVYWICVFIVLLTGLAKTFGIGKGAMFYAQNGNFHIKVTLFLLLVFLSIFPSVNFLKRLAEEKKDSELVEIPKRIIMFIRVELLILLIVPLLAVLMARGVGL